MGIGNINRINRQEIQTQAIRNKKPETQDTSVFVSDKADSQFAQNVINQYVSLAGNNRKVSNVIILSSPDVSEIEEIKELDDESKAVITDYINNGAEDAYGFYSKKADSIIIIESNHGRKEAKYEGELAEQGADTMLHEYAHLLDTNISSSDVYKDAYYNDLKEIEHHLNENPDEKIAGTDMTYRDAMVYFDHYYEGADFSDGITKNDVTRRGLRENFAESYATVCDNCESDVNAIYSAMFPNSTAVVREFVA